MSKNTKKSVWAFTTYFAEGFPYSLVRQISSVFFKDHGASLQAIGLTSLYGLPWVLKFLWAPFIDEFSSRRNWLITCEFILASAVIAIAFTSGLSDPLSGVAVLFLVTGLLSATHDIAIDGFYLEHMNRKEQAEYVGFQAMSYRIALIAGGGGIVFLSGITSWRTGFLTASLILFGLGLFHTYKLPASKERGKSIYLLLRYLKKPGVLLTFILATASILTFRYAWTTFSLKLRESGFHFVTKIKFPQLVIIILFIALIILGLNLKRIRKKLFLSDSFYARAFVEYLNQPSIWVTLAFIILYRSGESLILSMLYPFLRDLGISRAEYGLAYGTFGIAASITGGLIGGKLISKFGLKKAIWPLVLSQNIMNLLYMLLSYMYRDTGIMRKAITEHLGFSISSNQMLLSDPGCFLSLLQSLSTHTASAPVVTLFIVFEAFGAGMGTAVFMVFIMRTCKKEFKSAHMSIATSIMSISATFAGVFSGFIASWLGFTTFFGLTFLATIPSMALIPFLPYLKQKSQK